MPATAFAQSTGTVTTEEEATIVVTGTRTRDVGGLEVPDTTKAKAVVTQELIEQQAAGQTIGIRHPGRRQRCSSVPPLDAPAQRA